MDSQIKAKSFEFGFGLWLLYFIVTILVIGLPLTLGLVIPLYLIGYFIPVGTGLADRYLNRGVRLLMAVQPWFSIEKKLDLPNGGKGFLLIANHRSHLDAFILLSQITGIRLLAKKSLFFIPGLGLMMRLTGQISAKRGSVSSFLKAIEEVKTKVLAGEVVNVFPEMTRCSPGLRGTQSFTLAPFQAAMQGGFSIIPLVFQYTDEVWPKFSFTIHSKKVVRVRALTPMDPKEFKSSEDLMKETRRRIEQALLT